MKKKFRLFWRIFNLIVFVLLAVMFFTSRNCSQVYPLAVTVDSVNRVSDTVQCYDGAGNLWEFSGVEDWFPGDVAALLMDDNATPWTISDDKVLGVRYGFSMIGGA